MATISIRDLLIEAKHGVHEHEKTKTQPFKLDIEATYDTRNAQHSDDVADTLDYSAVRNATIELVQSTSFDLLERLAQVLADELFESFPRIEQLRVSIAKPAVYDNGVPGVTIDFTR